jgi:hypothetical protein
VKDSSAQSIVAEIPYMRSDLDRLAVEYTARILDDETIARHDMQIRNGRAASEPPSLEREGFQIATWPSRVVRERLDELMGERTPLQTPKVQYDYWNDTIPLIRQMSGAREVVPVHASTVRFSPKAEKRKYMTPAGWAHLDYSAGEVEVQLKESLELNRCKFRPYTRFVLYQGWRALSAPPQDFPLAICDGRTVDPAADIVPIEYHLKSGPRDVTYKSRASRYSGRHRWWYFPEMTIDEMLVLIGFDSARPDTMNPLHVAFEDKTARKPVPRASIETRYFALFD